MYKKSEVRSWDLLEGRKEEKGRGEGGGEGEGEKRALRPPPPPLDAADLVVIEPRLSPSALSVLPPLLSSLSLTSSTAFSRSCRPLRNSIKKT